MKVDANRRARRNVIMGASLSAIAATAILATTSAGAQTDDRPSGIYAMTEADIEAIRTTTEAFATSEAAVAAGRIDLDLCFDMMGDHFADPATFADGILDPADPEALVYADVDGAPKLVAVEWVSTSPGEVLGIPLHLNHDLDVWVLHAWVGLDNPSGMHADHNPEIGACPTA